MVIEIDYDEPNHEAYSHTAVDKVIFKSGDFIRDWFQMKKYISNISDNEWEPVSYSSSVNHFIQDGAPYDSAYLHIINDKPVLKYFDREDPNWFMTEIDNGIEFFVPENEQWTWEKLKEYCEYGKN